MLIAGKKAQLIPIPQGRIVFVHFIQYRLNNCFAHKLRAVIDLIFFAILINYTNLFIIKGYHPLVYPLKIDLSIISAFHRLSD
jgi:hypothetical protein